MSFYQKHVFVCENLRANGKRCCGQHQAQQARAHIKARLKDLKLTGAGKLRINLAGCMGRCSEGPVLAIYPEGIWYTYSSLADIDEIIDQHLVRGEPVSRLRLPDNLDQFQA